MKILLCLIALSFVGCASVSEYNQGCREGVSGLPWESDNLMKKPDMVGYYCNMKEHQKEQKERDEWNRRPREPREHRP